MQHVIKYSFLGFVMAIVFFSCEKDLPANPYENLNNNNNDTTTVGELDPNSFAGLHKNIFSTTCAKSGCHDGTFEPDFRTIESAYNTLVYQPIIKNDTLNTFKFRVVPGNINASILYIRLTQDLNGNSGLMPLDTLDSDWPEKKDDYIQNVVNWIQNGAPDALGNLPVLPNKKPQMLGVIAFPTGSSTPFSRTPNGTIRISPGSNSIDIWFSIKDDSTATANLTNNKVKFSLFMNDFDSAQVRNLDVVNTPLIAEGIEDNVMVNYYHKITINPNDFILDLRNIVYMRIYIKDPQNDIVEIPSLFSENVFKTYFTYKMLQ